MNRVGINGRVLIVDHPGGVLTGMVSPLKELGYNTVRVSGLDAAVRFASNLRGLSVLVVSTESVGDNPQESLNAIRTAHPELPIVWLVPKGQPEPAWSRASDFNSADPLVVRSHVASLLGARSYPPPLVTGLQRAASDIMQEFGLPWEPVAPYTKSSSMVLSDISSFLNFAGEGSFGHLVLTGSRSDVTAAYRAAGRRDADPRDDDLEDLLGELGNQLLSRMKRVLYPSGARFEMGVPSFVRGTAVHFRHKAGMPVLVLEFADGARALRVYFCLDRFDPAGRHARTDEEFVAPGRLKIL